MNRSAFIAGLAATPSVFAASPAASEPAESTPRGASALVLSGGGARGAYEAGIIDAMRSASQTPDGKRLPGVDVVCGASIGSINAWFVATGQYAKLSALWHGIGKEHIFELKRRFAATANPHAFIVVKIIQALGLAQGLTKNVQGIFEGQNVADWIDREIDLTAPLVMPYIFAVTNLDRARTELFYRLPSSFLRPKSPDDVIARIVRSVGPSAVLREATDDIIKEAMRASAAIPVLFDPVVLPSPEGTMDRYVDGGIADNNPIDVGRALARSVYTVLVDPVRLARQPYANALEIVLGVFGVDQTRILEASLTAAYLETREKRIDDGSLSADNRRLLDTVADADLFFIRPQNELAAGVVDFDRQEKVDATFAAGTADFQRGWSPFTLVPDARAAY